MTSLNLSERAIALILTRHQNFFLYQCEGHIYEASEISTAVLLFLSSDLTLLSAKQGCGRHRYRRIQSQW